MNKFYVCRRIISRGVVCASPSMFLLRQSSNTCANSDMSVNHYYSELPDAADGCWPNSLTESPPPNHDRRFLVPAGGIFCLQTTTPAPPPFAFNLNLNNDEDEELDKNSNYDAAATEEWLRDREMLFEKPLTPSDVGKLNRLVIPKQYAERHFPMNCGGESCENGLLLNFMDEIGTTWRFRYSYWNSSQSYVLTKGWSRFVKEKRLDAGDVVTFSRHRASTGSLFIGWRRRNQIAAASGDGRGWNRENSGQPKNPGPPTGSSPVQQNQAITGNNSFKTLRLFGVNLEFHGGETQTSTPVDSAYSSHANPYHQYYSNTDMMSFSEETSTRDCLSGRRDEMWES